VATILMAFILRLLVGLVFFDYLGNGEPSSSLRRISGKRI
jgi:hypothetical protein